MPDPRDADNPLDAAHLAKLRRAAECCSRAGLLVQKAHDCGIDCRAEQASTEALAERVNRMLHHFGGKTIQA